MDPEDGFDRAATDFSAVVLAGGTAVRMGGIDKARIEFEGRSLLARAIEACIDADEVVVVGDPVTTERTVTFVRETPPHGGPVAGFLAGVDALRRRPAHVGVLAVDMPHVVAATFRRLREAMNGSEAAFLYDEVGGRRHLAGVFDAVRLDVARPGLRESDGMAVHRLLDRLHVVDVAAVGQESHDVDTWTDLYR